MSKISRRDFISQLGVSSLALSSLSALPFLLRSQRAVSAPNPKHRLIIVFLAGGADENLGFNPVVGSKVSSSAFEDFLKNAPTRTVPGKNNLVVGQGLLPAVPAFQKMPTALVRGVFVEVTAHLLAQHYLHTGRQSLSRTRTYDSVAAALGRVGKTTPSHVNLGFPAPLGQSKKDGSLLYASGPQEFRSLLAGPHGPGFFSETGIETAHRLIASLNEGFDQKLLALEKKTLAEWNNAEMGAEAIYAQQYFKKFRALPKKYADAGRFGAYYHSALEIIRTGLTPYVTIFTGGFDTHYDTNYEGQLKEYSEAFRGLEALVDDLNSTADPFDEGKTLAQNTNIVFLTDFGRTPKMNFVGGTDHWQTGIVAVMGRGVNDNTVLGATDDNARAMGFENGSPVPMRPDHSNALLPQFFHSALMAHMGAHDLAAELSDQPLKGLFR